MHKMFQPLKYILNGTVFMKKIKNRKIIGSGAEKQNLNERAIKDERAINSREHGR